MRTLGCKPNVPLKVQAGNGIISDVRKVSLFILCPRLRGVFLLDGSLALEVAGERNKVNESRRFYIPVSEA